MEEVIVTYLEMRSRPTLTVARPYRGVMLLRLEQPTAAFYRYLYTAVGSRWMSVYPAARNALTLRVTHVATVMSSVRWDQAVDGPAQTSVAMTRIESADSTSTLMILRGLTRCTGGLLT